MGYPYQLVLVLLVTDGKYLQCMNTVLRDLMKGRFNVSARGCLEISTS